MSEDSDESLKVIGACVMLVTAIYVVEKLGQFIAFTFKGRY